MTIQELQEQRYKEVILQSENMQDFNERMKKIEHSFRLRELITQEDFINYWTIKNFPNVIWDKPLAYPHFDKMSDFIDGNIEYKKTSVAGKVSAMNLIICRDNPDAIGMEKQRLQNPDNGFPTAYVKVKPEIAPRFQRVGYTIELLERKEGFIIQASTIGGTKEYLGFARSIDVEIKHDRTRIGTQRWVMTKEGMKPIYKTEERDAANMIGDWTKTKEEWTGIEWKEVA